MSTLPEPVTPKIHLAQSCNQSQPLTGNAVITPISQQDSIKTAQNLARRLYLVLHDAGLVGHLPAGWLQATPTGLLFASLTVREADAFVVALEGLALGGRAQRPNVNPDQLRLF